MDKQRQSHQETREKQFDTKEILETHPTKLHTLKLYPLGSAKEEPGYMDEVRDEAAPSEEPQPALTRVATLRITSARSAMFTAGKKK